MKYTNPIIPGFHPDPSICVVGNDYYLVTSSFEFFPGVPIYHSTDMVNWELIGHCLTRKSQLNLDKAEPSGGIWAPTLRYNNGTFYMITTNMSDRGNFYVTAKDPAGPWSEPIVLPTGGIDPSLFFDDDGKVYYMSNQYDAGAEKDGIYMAEIDIETGKFLSDFKFVSNGTGGLAVEGPHLYKINGMYYFMFAEGGTHYGHMETIFRSENVWGPYESCPHNPIITHRNKFHEIQGTGHGDLAQDANGDWWLVFLAFRITGGNWHHIGRETFLLPVEWEDNWPVVNKNLGVEINMEIERNGGVQNTDLNFFDDFSAPELNKRYNFIKNPIYENYKLMSQEKTLRLIPTKNLLGENQCTFLGIRQQHFDIKTSAEMTFSPEFENDEAGITVYRNSDAYIRFYIKKKGEKNYLCVTQNIGEIVYTPFEKVIESDNIKLTIKSDKQKYYFEFSESGSASKQAACASTRFLAAEVCYGPFTGVYLGMYATGRTHADFKNFSYENVTV